MSRRKALAIRRRWAPTLDDLRVKARNGVKGAPAEYLRALTKLNWELREVGFVMGDGGVVPFVAREPTEDDLLMQRAENGDVKAAAEVLRRLNKEVGP